MQYKIVVSQSLGEAQRNVIIDRGGNEFTSFPTEVGNPNYDAFLESQGLTDAEVQAMEPDVWHDLSAT